MRRGARGGDATPHESIAGAEQRRARTWWRARRLALAAASAVGAWNGWRAGWIGDAVATLRAVPNVGLPALAAVVSGMPAWRPDEVTSIAGMGLDSLGPPPPDPTNAVADDPDAAALGARLFADTRLSATGTISCASCHQPARDFQDGRPLGVGVGATARRTMSVVGAAYSPWQFWDGRADSPWAQALGPLESAQEHGGTRALYVRVLATHYRAEYARLFGALPALGGVPAAAGPLGTTAARAAWARLPSARRDSLSRAFANLGKAIAAFERTLRYPRTRFDDYAAALAAGRRPRAGEILSADEAAGLRLFVGRGECATCHTGPRFTDDAFHNTGVPEVPGLPRDDGRIAAVEVVRADPFNCAGAYADVGGSAGCEELRFMATGAAELLRAYRVPSLRGVAERAPYMHAGQLPTLAAVIEHYASAPRSPRGRSELHPVRLTAVERRQLEAFLRSLSARSSPARGTATDATTRRPTARDRASPPTPRATRSNVRHCGADFTSAAPITSLVRGPDAWSSAISVP